MQSKRRISIGICKPLHLYHVSALLVCVALLAGTGCNQPKTRVGKVVGSSMGIAALGDHLDCQCSNCQFPFDCDPDQADSRAFLVCPNCGFDKIGRADCIRKNAESVEIQLGNNDITRWDVVAFKMPDSQDAGIKRVVGLPQESVSIRDGNVFINGKVVRKPIERQKAMRILVHDSSYVANRQHHWVNRHRSSGWTAESATFKFDPDEHVTEIDWMYFQPGRHYSHQIRNDHEIVTVEDSYGFNQSVSRNLNAMDELFLSVEAEVTSTSIVGVRFDHRSTIYEFQINVKNRELSVMVTGEEPDVIPIDPSILASSELQLEFSSIDLQLNLLINGKIVFHKPLGTSTAAVSKRPLEVGARGGVVVLNRIRIWRDIFYFGIHGELTSQFDRADHQSGYILLGDNVPLSIDSRHWDPASIDAGDIIGKAKIERNQ